MVFIAAVNTALDHFAGNLKEYYVKLEKQTTQSLIKHT